MQHLVFALLLSFPFLTYSQTKRQKLSRDSINYYITERNKLTRATYVSLRSSEKYKEIMTKLNPNGNSAKSNFGVELTVFAGGQINGYGNLNTRLKSLNVGRIKNFMGNLGIGLAFRFNKVIVGYDMVPLLIGDNSGGAYIHGYLSTNSIKTKKWIFSPQIGVGGQAITTRITKDGSSPNFNSYFTSSANQVQLQHSNTVLDFAIALKLRNERNEVYIPVFRVGYRYGLGEEMWKVKGGSAIDGPLDRVSNLYFQFMLGSGD